MRGLVLGKFLPYHAGHAHLIRVARSRVDELVVLVCSISVEPIDGRLRFEWVKQAHSDCKVVHVEEEVPQAPEDHPQFWDIWTDLIARHAGHIDVVFTSESYGEELALRIGARHDCVDIDRTEFPVSGSAIRRDPQSNWRFLSPPMRAYFTHRIAIVGPESAGKTTLARRLASEFAVPWVPEFGRLYSEGLDPRTFNHADFEAIARGQAGAEDAAAGGADGFLICDTELHTTCTWSELILGECRAALREAAEARKYDLYLLLKPDVAWTNDGTRVLEDRRIEHFAMLERELMRTNRRYRTIGGDGDERVATAIRAVAEVLALADWPINVGKVDPRAAQG